MKAIKKPIPIEVEEFQPDRLPWPPQVHSRSGGWEVFNALHGSWIGIKPGDYINVTDPSGRDIHPIDRETFERTYDVIKTVVVFLAFMLWSALAFAQPTCQTVMLPDLGPVGETPVTGGIATSFFVPPFTEAGTFYPVVIYSDKQGNVGIWQNTGVGEKPLREFKGVTSISLVWWLSFYEAALAPIKAVGYKILPNSVSLGQLPNPTWAFRETQIFDQPIANTNLSLPVQLGEVWNVGIENPYREPIRYNLQIESRICQ